MSETGYQIDYDQVDVRDLMRQVQARARDSSGTDPRLPDTVSDSRSRLQDYLNLDDEEPYRLQQRLGLDGDWNLSPEDLRTSHPGVIGGVIRTIRRLLRPLTKLMVNADLPLFKQFKVNTGLAAAAHDLMQENDLLRHQLDALTRRLEKLETAARDNDA